MIMLIPVGAILALTAVIMLTAMLDNVEAEITQTEYARRAISMHHQQIIEQVLPEDGYVDMPAGGVFSAFGGIRSYSFIAGGSIYVITFISDHSQPQGNAPQVPVAIDTQIRTAMSKSTSDIRRLQASRGLVFGGEITFLEGPFPASVENVLLPFSPPIRGGSPVILSVFTGHS